MSQHIEPRGNGVRCEIGDTCYRKECSEAGTCRPPCPICGRDTMLRAIGCYRCIAEGKQP